MVIPSLGHWRLRGLFDISPLCLAAPCSVGQRLPLLGFWELTCSCSSKMTLWNVLFSSWDMAIYNLVLTLFFSSFILVIPDMSTSFSLSPSCSLSLLSPCLISQSLLSLVVVSVQPRWRAAKLSLHYQRVASQNLSYLKWKAEHRLRVINFFLQPKPGQAVAGVPWARIGPWLSEFFYPQTSCVLPELSEMVGK